MTATAPRIVTVRQNILKANDHTAAENRRTFEAAGVRAINLASSPGAGKTALLERTLRDLAGGLNMAVWMTGSSPVRYSRMSAGSSSMAMVGSSISGSRGAISRGGGRRV